MSQQIEIHAELRLDVGKGASRRLRRLAEKVPGILYGGEDDAVALTMKYNELSKAMELESFYSQILNVVVGGKTQQAVVRDLQRNPTDDKVIHVDFLRVRADRAIHVHIPLHFINEEKCVGVRLAGGSISHNMVEVEVSCLPKDLPQFIEIDMESVDLHDVVHLTDISLPDGVSIVALMHDEDHDANVASVQSPRGGGEDEDEAEAAAGEEGADEQDAEGGSDEEPSEG
jgi:large subunit ribosomal protein L25